MLLIYIDVSDLSLDVSLVISVVSPKSTANERIRTNDREKLYLPKSATSSFLATKTVKRKTNTLLKNSPVRSQI